MPDKGYLTDTGPGIPLWAQDWQHALAHQEDETFWKQVEPVVLP